MSGKKVEDRYKARSKNIESRGYSSQRGNPNQSRHRSPSIYQKPENQNSRQRENPSRRNIRQKGRAGCLVSIGLLVVIIIGLYFLIFKTSIFDPKNTNIKNEEPTSSYTAYLQYTPSPTPKLQSTEVPTATPEVVSTIGYVSTEDEDGVVRLRSDAQGAGGVAGEVHNREVLYLLGKEGNYYKIRHRGEIAYILASYVVEHMPEDNMLCDVVTQEIKYSKLVEVTAIVPDLIVEMPYATESNHVNKQMYPFELVLLQETTAYKLKKAQEMFLKDGYSLVIWDAYRPYTVTVENFEVIQNTKLAADPEVGSKHNRGAALDLTLYNLNTGEYVDMPTEVREMNLDLARRNSPYMTYAQRQNMQYMENIMKKAGFSPYAGEWWHYNDMDVADYPVLDIQFESWEN
ncbi:MAG: M15 family metallopeptidase [Eubacteriales bacterium]